MTQRILGDEEVARLHERDGQPTLAVIHRLPVERAVRLLQYVAIAEPEVWADALAAVHQYEEEGKL